MQNYSILPKTLPGDEPTDSPNAYILKKPIEVDAGVVAPAFGKEGMGGQYVLPKSITDLLDSEHLERKK